MTELLHLKLCLLRNICAITRKMEGTNNYEHMKKKLSHQRNGHYERSMETNWRRSQKLWLLHSVSAVMKKDCPMKGPYLPLILLSLACVKNEYLLNTVSGALYPPTSASLPLFPDPVAFFTRMSSIIMCHWKTCLSSHGLSLIFACFLMLLLWLITRQPAHLTNC